MSRTRTISQSKAVYLSPSAIDPDTYSVDTGTLSDLAFRPTLLDRVDTFSFSTDYAGSREDVFVFGQLSRISTIRQGETLSTVSLGHYLLDGRQEDLLGLNASGYSTGSGVPISQIIASQQTSNPFGDQKNIYALTVPEGQDAFGYANQAAFEAAATGFNVVAFGNGTLTSYSANFSVGEIPRADSEFECNNVEWTTGDVTLLPNPSIDKETAAGLAGVYTLPYPTLNLDSNTIGVLKNGDIVLNIEDTAKPEGGADYASMHIQSFGIEVPLSREAIERLGNQQPFAKPLDTPLVANISINAIVGEIKEGSLASILTGCEGDQGIAMTVSVKNPCDGTTGLVFNIQDAILDSEDFSLGLDDNETVDLSFSVTLGGSTSTGAGVYLFGSYPSKTNNVASGFEDRFNTGQF